MNDAADILERADSAVESGDLLTAIDSWRAALASAEPRGEAWARAARRAESIGDSFGAVGLARRYCAEGPNTAASAFLLASTLTEAGFASEAVALLRPYAEAGALSPNETFKFTRMLSFAGELDEANARARALLRNTPYSPTLWGRIAETKRFKTGDPDIDAMEQVLARLPETKPVSRAAIARALGKAYIEIGDDCSAARVLELRAKAARERIRFEPARYNAAAHDIAHWCVSAPPEPPMQTVPESERAIFIIGPPRSGTTLVEQILSRHSRVKAGGERRHLMIAGAACGDFAAASIDAALQRAGDRLWRVIGARYVALSEELLGPGAFTDKLLSNHYRVRVILQALPRARILYVRRNALDLAWSCWRAQFDEQSPWANSETGVALYIRTYREIMSAWQLRYPSRIVDVSYEDLVRDPSAQIPRLVAACGLDDEPATRTPERAARAVNTLSFAEVRAAIDPRRAESARDFPLATRRLAEELEKAGVFD